MATLESAGPGSIVFLARTKYRKQLATTGAVSGDSGAGDGGRNVAAEALSPNPYATFAKVASILHPAAPAEPGLHPSAVVDPAARIAPSASIGPRCDHREGHCDRRAGLHRSG